MYIGYIHFHFLIFFASRAFLQQKTHEGNKPTGRPRNVWGMDFEEIGWEGVNWIHLAQDRDQFRGLVNTVMKFLVP
jgi:hypothetical protein